jgi:NAD-dependent deacetylase
MVLDRTQYSRIVVLTGAGISAGSGLRTYRGPDGVWEEYEVERYGHADALAEQPEQTWRLFGGMREPVLRARPNAAHLALAQWEAELSSGQELLLVTQNVDGLHQEAGSRNVVELHGNIMYTRCSSSTCTLERYREEGSHEASVPRCPRCGSVLRPDVVLFGEEIPPAAGGRSSARCATATCSSPSAHPASSRRRPTTCEARSTPERARYLSTWSPWPNGTPPSRRSTLGRPKRFFLG